MGWCRRSRRGQTRRLEPASRWLTGGGQLNVWILLLGAMNAMDVLTTAICLRAGRVELNPVMALFLNHGELVMDALKLATILGIIALIDRASRRYRRVWPLWVLPVGLTGFAVVNNLLLIAGG